MPDSPDSATAQTNPPPEPRPPAPRPTNTARFGPQTPQTQDSRAGHSSSCRTPTQTKAHDLGPPVYPPAAEFHPPAAPPPAPSPDQPPTRRRTSSPATQDRKSTRLNSSH